MYLFPYDFLINIFYWLLIIFFMTLDVNFNVQFKTNALNDSVPLFMSMDSNLLPCLTCNNVGRI